MQNKPPFTHQDYEIVNKEIVYQGVFRMVRYHLRHKLYNGQWSNVVVREVMERKSAVAVILYDPNLNAIVMIEQFRPGAFKQPQNPWLLEIVAGVFGASEQPEQVAIREAYEEAGCRITHLESICNFFVSPGGSDEYLYLYCGHIDASAAGGTFGLIEEDEDIRSFVLPLPEAINLLNQGKIQTSPAIIAVQWLIINQTRLQNLWQKNQ